MEIKQVIKQMLLYLNVQQLLCQTMRYLHTTR